MKISLVYNVFPGISGESVFFESMKRHLVPAIEKNGFNVECVPVPHSSFPLEFYTRFPLLMNAGRLLRRSDADIVHFLNSSLAPASARPGCRRIASAHLLGDSYGSLPPREGILERAAGRAFRAYAKAIDARPLREMEAVAACTPFQARDITGTYALDERRVRVIPPGIDRAGLTDAPLRDLRGEFGCEKAILYAGRLQERSKGVSYAIRAMAHLEGCKLLVMGSGPDSGSYKALARRLGLGEKVVFLGALDHAGKCSLQRSADAAVIPSLRDVFCTVFAESLACGVPVAAFDMPFWKGLYDGAATYAEMSPEALAAAIGEALERKTVARGLELARKHDVRNTVASYISLYEEVSAR